MGTTGKKRFLVESYASYYALLLYVIVPEGHGRGDDDDQLVRHVKSDTALC